VFGLSTQDNVYQTEMASRLHLPFPVLSDDKLKLTKALKLPTMKVAGLTLIKRLALIIDNGRIRHVFYPVFPPDRNAADVLAWLRENPA
jgi:peroxiredoxin